MSDSISDGGDCRTAPATPGLLKKSGKLKCSEGSQKNLPLFLLKISRNLIFVGKIGYFIIVISITTQAGVAEPCLQVHVGLSSGSTKYVSLQLTISCVSLFKMFLTVLAI